ncbi:hypothetical protein ACIGXM_15045 [Kitasatospora sp. NPDC052896]|uniref:hypothetical protein n=1 Tax=Kitasatospora sp. NPDC052896 TaxID=3364061 RepID=UPI0037CAE20C
MTYRLLAGAVAGAALTATVLLAAPAAQAAPAATPPVNCGNVYIGTAGNQQFLHAACSPVTAHSWSLVVQCSNNLTYSAGPYTTFEDVSVYCPAGTTVTNGWYTYS